MVLRDALRSALRGLVARPLFSALVILTLAVGIGANTAIFTVADATLRRGLPYPDAGRLFTMWETRQREDIDQFELAFPTFVDIRAEARSFEALAGFTRFTATLSAPGPSEVLQAGYVTGNFFGVLGARVVLGRSLTPADEGEGAARAVVLSHALWQERFGGDASILGKTVTLNDEPTTVVGIVERGFAFAPADGARLWIPLHPRGGMLTRRNLHWLHGLARLAPGVTASDAQAELTGITGRLAHAYPDSNTGGGARLVPLSDEVLGKARPIVVLLLAAVGLVLLIACANAANLLLSRQTARQKELAVRAALGAGQGTLVALLTVEAVVYALAAGALGVVFALWGVDLLISAVPASVRGAMPFLAGARVDVLALLATFALSLLTGVAVGVGTALRAARPDLADVLKEDGRGSVGPRRGRLRDVLVVGEIALAFTLLAGAGLVGRSLLAVLGTHPGFDAHELVTAQLALPKDYEGVAANVAVRAEVEHRLAAIPGVRDVAQVDILPLGTGGNTIRFVVAGQEVPVNSLEPEASIRSVSGNYFTLMGVPLVDGRAFDGRDDAKGAPVAIVNRTLAQRIFHGDAVDKSIRFTYKKDLPPIRIVGVVGDEHLGPLDAAPAPTLYVPILAEEDQTFAVLLRGTATADDVRRAVHGVSSGIAIDGIATMEERIARAPWMFVRRFPALLVGAFAALALFLTAIGIYGVLSYTVKQRTHEIGIRRAVGAAESHILRLVLGRAARLTLLGLGIGLICSLAAGRLMRSLLFEVAPWDPLTLVVVGGGLMVVALVAAFVPAWAAVRVDPLEALR